MDGESSYLLGFLEKANVSDTYVDSSSFQPSPTLRRPWPGATSTDGHSIADDGSLPMSGLSLSTPTSTPRRWRMPLPLEYNVVKMASAAAVLKRITAQFPAARRPPPAPAVESTAAKSIPALSGYAASHSDNGVDRVPSEPAGSETTADGAAMQALVDDLLGCRVSQSSEIDSSPKRKFHSATPEPLAQTKTSVTTEESLTDAIFSL